MDDTQQTPAHNPAQPTQEQLLEQERLTLWRAVTALGQAYDNISRDTHIQRDGLVQLMDRLAERAERPPAGGNTKHREPRVFNGRADQLDSFLREINNAIHLQRRSLSSDRDKIIYFSFYLADGTPSSWYRAIEVDKSKSHLLEDFDAFINDFRNRFRDSDQYASALRKIRKLKQTGSCAAFTNQFIEVLVELDWTEQTKIQEYYDRLKDTVKATLCNRKGRYFSQDFDEYSKACIDIDNELHSLSLDTSHRSFTTPSSSAPRKNFNSPSVTSSTFTQSSGNNDIVPMEIDSIRRGPLSVEEKARRKKEGLCMYCGQGKHFAAACPNKKASPSGKA